MSDNIDEIDSYFGNKKEPTGGEAIKMEHIMIEKVSINPARRKLLRKLGSSERMKNS